MYYGEKGHVLQHKRACIIKDLIFYFFAVSFNNLNNRLVSKAL